MRERKFRHDKSDKCFVSSCGAAEGHWCVRHGNTQPGPLLACPERAYVVGGLKPCPIGEIAGDRHLFRRGTGRLVFLDMMGHPNHEVEVCPACAAMMPDDESESNKSLSTDSEQQGEE